MKQRLALAASIVVAGFALTSTAYGITFGDSNARLDGVNLTLDVTSPESGWAVVHDVKNGKIGRQIGHAAIHKGDNKNVYIKLSQYPVPGETLIVMLHEDTGKKGIFEFGGDSKADKPVMEKGKPVTAPIVIG